MFAKILRSFRSAWGRPAWRAAILVALASDALGFGVVLLLPLQWMLDSVTALAIWALLGFRWYLLPALAIEVVPALELFPAWTLAVAAYAAAEPAKEQPVPPSAPAA